MPVPESAMVIRVRHHDIGQHEVREPLFDHLQRDTPVFRGPNVKAL
jgi:hypothetical protein